MTIRLTLAALLAVSTPAFAESMATGAEISAAISGNTVQGSMSDSGAYTEFYAADGSIKGKDYSGEWTVEGDTMCFCYGDAPDCWNVRLKGDAVTWVQDGEDGGTGTIIAGNPDGF